MIVRTKRLTKAVVEQFEGQLDFVKTLDPIPFYIKAAAAEVAAQAALDYLERHCVIVPSKAKE